VISLCLAWVGAPLIVGYHSIGGPPEFAGGPTYDKHGLNISPETFRAQLEALYNARRYPVNISDLASERTRLPKGWKPVALTFDDGRASQYRILPDGTLDPSCALGVMIAFHKRHPDWPLRGTFYLIAGSDENGVPFDQEGLEKRKVRTLLQLGFEIGNHTLSHPSFRGLGAGVIRREIGGCQRYLRRLIPGIRIASLALPYGELPRDRRLWPLLFRGRWHGIRYRYSCVMLFGDPVPGGRFPFFARVAPNELPADLSAHSSPPTDGVASYRPNVRVRHRDSLKLFEDFDRVSL